jgi:hypothetical protein
VCSKLTHDFAGQCIEEREGKERNMEEEKRNMEGRGRNEHDACGVKYRQGSIKYQMADSTPGLPNQAYRSRLKLQQIFARYR